MPHSAFRSILRPPIGPLLHRRILSACPADLASRPRYLSVNTLPSGCPSCQAPLPTPLPACPKCFYIAQVSPNQTYYQVLDAPYEPNPFLVDLGKLRTQYRNLQWCVHPDIWTARGEDKVYVARSLSGLANKAYKTLKDPLSRVEYILRLEDTELLETDQTDDQQLIMEIMEAREALEEAASPEDVESVRADNHVKIMQTIKELERLVGSKEWKRTRIAAVRLKYLSGIEDAAKGSDHSE